MEDGGWRLLAHSMAASAKAPNEDISKSRRARPISANSPLHRSIAFCTSPPCPISTKTALRNLTPEADQAYFFSGPRWGSQALLRGAKIPPVAGKRLSTCLIQHPQRWASPNRIPSPPPPHRRTTTFPDRAPPPSLRTLQALLFIPPSRVSLATWVCINSKLPPLCSACARLLTA